MSVLEERIFQGLSISPGIGIGAPLFLYALEEEIPETTIADHHVEREIERYRRALILSRQDIEKLHLISVGEGPAEIAHILNSHLEMLQDPCLTIGIEEKIRQDNKNSESIVLNLIDEYKRRFRKIKDDHFRERIRDIIDVSRRVLGHLLPLPLTRLKHIPPHSILFANELVPSDAIEAYSAQVVGFVTASGGVASHAAIIARAHGIPYVAHIDLEPFHSIVDSSIIIDGEQGIVIANPSPETLKKYLVLKKRQKHNLQELQTEALLETQTADEVPVRLFANLERVKEIDRAIGYGVVGVGLVRTEYFLLSRKRFLTENEQFTIYRSLAQRLANKPLVIRIFDIGSDKRCEFDSLQASSHCLAALGEESNPALGCRGVRFLLRFPQILDVQLRALLRAAQYGTIHILVPMVADLSEIQQVRTRIQELAVELGLTHIHLPIGCMVEIPSIALLASSLAKEVDFLSIGTNDLMQYTLAVDRNNAALLPRYSPAHPSILKLIHLVVAAAHQYHKPLLVCGESASDPMMIPLLLGLGIREFSISNRMIPSFKKTLRKWAICDAEGFARRALNCSSAEEIKLLFQQLAK